MENWLYASLPVILKTAASVIGIMTVVIIIVRIAGLRTFAKMSSFDFASTIAVGSIMATTIMNTGQSLTKAAAAMAAIIGLQVLFSQLKRRSNAVEALIENKPTLLMDGPTILKDNMSRTGVTHADLMAKLREANVIQLSEVKAVVLETTGDISVLHSSGDEALADVLLAGVRR